MAPSIGQTWTQAKRHELTCAGCGKTFIGRKSQKYCCDTCARAAKHDAYEATRFDTNPAAIARFMPGTIAAVSALAPSERERLRNVFASRERSIRDWAGDVQKTRKAMDDVDICPVCGKRYTRKSTTQLYCSASCKRRNTTHVMHATAESAERAARIALMATPTAVVRKLKRALREV